MNRRYLALLLLTAATFAAGYWIGKNRTYQEIADHPRSCVPGQIVEIPNGDVLLCGQVNTFKQVN